MRNSRKNRKTISVIIIAIFGILSFCPFIAHDYKKADDNRYDLVQLNVKKSERVSAVLNDKKYIDGQLIVSVSDFDKNYKSSDFCEIKSKNVTEIFKSDSQRILLIDYDISKAAAVETVKSILSKRDDVIDVELDQTGEWFDALPNDYNASLDWYVSKIKLDKAWNICTDSSSTKIGIIDTGIDSSHPDLSGCLDTSLGVSFSPNSTNPYQPLIFHGTWVAGILGAKGNNNLCISGVNWNCKLVSLRVDGEAEGFIDEFGNSQPGCQEKLSLVISAINYAQNNNIPILNFSGGFSNESSALRNAINGYDGLLVCACGNDGNCLDVNPVYPACYDCPNIISVGATNSSDNMSDTNYSNVSVDLFAPGHNIRGLLMGTSGVYTNSGTSAASPIVAGVAGLIKSVNPLLTTSQIKSAIMNSVDLVSSLNNYCVTGGRLNALKAITYALKDCATLPSGGSQTYNNILSPSVSFLGNVYANSENYVRINSVPGTFDFETTGDLTTIGTLLVLNWNILENAGGNGVNHNFRFTHTFTTFETFILKITGTGISSSIGLKITNHHNHQYDSSYLWVNGRKHKSLCQCSTYILQGHACLSSNPHVCSLCGGYAEMGFIGPFNAASPNAFISTPIHNDSLLLINGNILIGPIDESLIFNGGLTYEDLYQYASI
jgi:subtilisin family serine protease